MFWRSATTSYRELDIFSWALWQDSSVGCVYIYICNINIISLSDNLSVITPQGFSCCVWLNIIKVVCGVPSLKSGKTWWTQNRSTPISFSICRQIMPKLLLQYQETIEPRPNKDHTFQQDYIVYIPNKQGQLGQQEIPVNDGVFIYGILSAYQEGFYQRFQ